jgi:hypothetical protein
MTDAILVLDTHRLEKLPPDALSRELMYLPAKERLETILNRPDSAAVVAALAEQDFFLTVMELGPNDALPMLALAQMQQLNLLFDLQWWQKDQILPARAIGWIERLSRASGENLTKWLFQADFELLVILFKRWLRVEAAPDDVDLLEARDQLPPHTFDEQYFWEARYPQYEDLLRTILGYLFETQQYFYLHLINHVIWPIDAEVEEEALRFHRARLEDLAIPDFYDALEIYRAIRPDEIPTQKESLALGMHPLAPPTFALALLPENDLLGRALRQIHDQRWLETLQYELAALANKVVVVDQLAPDEAEALKQAVDKVAACVNLGLEVKSAGDLEVALSALREMFLEHLFRLGYAQVARVRGRLQQLSRSGWLAQWPAGLAVLEPDWMEAAELLLGKTPRLLRIAGVGGLGGGGARPDLLRTRLDLSDAKQVVDVIIALGPVFAGLKVDPARLQTCLWPDGQVRELPDVTLGKLLWTAAANRLWLRRWEPEPLPVTAWGEVFPHLSAGAMEQVITEWLAKVVLQNDHRRLVGTYVTPLLRAYGEELASYAPHHAPDPRFMSFFLFSEKP